jgi:ABC-type transport system, involved in lipoprotein release, permease component
MNRTLVWQLAIRYLRGKRAGNAVPILSRISMTAIAVSAGAMIVLFSVMNGFEELVSDLYKAFYPQVKITAAEGKFFSFSDAQLAEVKRTEGVAATTMCIEDNVLLNSNEEQKVATIKGIDPQYYSVNDIRPYIVEGADSVSDLHTPTAIIGMHIANDMAIDVKNVFNTLQLYYANTDVDNLSLAPESAFKMLELKPEGIFRVQDDFDAKYVLAPLPVVQELLQASGKYASVELKLKDGADEDDVKEALQKQLGNAYKVQTRFEQNSTMYMIMRSEKWAVFAILVLVLLIASFNMVGALSMLVLEKQKDISILRAMGASPAAIRNVFVAEGVLWAFAGGLAGVVLGGALCFLQKQFGFIKMQGSFIIDAYPVALQGSDFVLIMITVMIVGLIASWYPALKAKRTLVTLR